MIKVEIACNSYASCLNALKGGADRLELFENLADGGCTPSAGMIEKVKALALPCYVMIRPRGGDFCYSHDEIDIMLRDIEVCKTAHVDGIVFGCLTTNGEVDKALNQLLLKAWNNGPATFHRAIDRSADPLLAARVIADLGFERILSSGGTLQVMDGLDVLSKMQRNVGQHIVIMPGAGVNALNASIILNATGCTEIHATCKSIIDSNSSSLNNNFQDRIQITDGDEVALLVSNIKSALGKKD